MGRTLLPRTDGATLAQRTLQMMPRRDDQGGGMLTLDGAVITVVGKGTTFLELIAQLDHVYEFGQRHDII